MRERKSRGIAARSRVLVVDGSTELRAKADLANRRFRSQGMGEPETSEFVECEATKRGATLAN
jgi:hypothetical protein